MMTETRGRSGGQGSVQTTLPSHKLLMARAVFLVLSARRSVTPRTVQAGCSTITSIARLQTRLPALPTALPAARYGFGTKALAICRGRRLASGNCSRNRERTARILRREVVTAGGGDGHERASAGVWGQTWGGAAGCGAPGARAASELGR